MSELKQDLSVAFLGMQNRSRGKEGKRYRLDCTYDIHESSNRVVMWGYMVRPHSQQSVSFHTFMCLFTETEKIKNKKANVNLHKTKFLCLLNPSQKSTCEFILH